MIKEVDYDLGIITLDSKIKKGKKKDTIVEVDLDQEEAYEIYKLISEEREAEELEDIGRECLKEKYNQIEDDEDLEEDLLLSYIKQKREFLEKNREIIFRLAYLDLLENIQDDEDLEDFFDDEEDLGDNYDDDDV